MSNRPKRRAAGPKLCRCGHKASAHDYDGCRRCDYDYREHGLEPKCGEFDRLPPGAGPYERFVRDEPVDTSTRGTWWGADDVRMAIRWELPNARREVRA